MLEFLPNFQELLKDQIIDHKFTVTTFIVLTCCLMSACLSSSIAEWRLRARLPHTILGLFIPILYPVFIGVSLPKKVAIDKDKADVTKEEKDDSDLPLMDLNEEYFKAIYLTPEGQLTGPYLIDMESNIVKADCIAEVHSDFITIETANSNGKLQRMRVPYNKMTSCVLIDEERNSSTPRQNENSNSSDWLALQAPHIIDGIKNAQKTFHLFKEEISLESRRIVPVLEEAALIAHFPPNDKSSEGELLTVEEIRIEGDTIHGIIAATPKVLNYLSEGEEVSFNRKRIADWYYVTDGEGQGGYTFKATLALMSEAELEEASMKTPLKWFI